MNKHYKANGSDIIEVTPNWTIVASMRDRNLIGGIIRPDRGVVELIGGAEIAIDLEGEVK